MNTNTTAIYASYVIDKETVEDITALPAELQHLAWSLLARYGISGEVVDWTSNDPMMAYVSGAICRARQRIDAHRTASEQPVTAQTTLPPAQTAQPQPTQVIPQTAPTQVTAPTPILAQATTPEATATAQTVIPEEMMDLARTPDEAEALKRALTPAPVHASLYGGPTLEDVKSYWVQKGFSGTGLRYWVFYEGARWICSGSKVRNWRLVANSFGSHEKSSWTSKKQTAPAVTQTQTVPPANELPLDITAADLPANELRIDFEHPGPFGDDDEELDTDMDDRINGYPESYEIDDLLNDDTVNTADTGTPAATEANPNKMLGCGTAQAGTTPDGHEFKVTPDDDDLPF